MFARTVSLVLVAAIIACPLWCSSGLCDAGQCGSAEQSSRACSVHLTACCCCDQSSPDSDDPGPRPCPDKTSCQGVCGGAVFEKPIELNDVSDSFFVQLTDAATLLVAQLVECNFCGIEYHWHCRGGNHGRFLRTLHMSFLC